MTFQDYFEICLSPAKYFKTFFTDLFSNSWPVFRSSHVGFFVGTLLSYINGHSSLKETLKKNGDREVLFVAQ